MTFDSDFYDIANLKGHPPKIIWLRYGNTTTHNIANKLIEKRKIISDFIKSEDYANTACIEMLN